MRTPCTGELVVSGLLARPLAASLVIAPAATRLYGAAVRDRTSPQLEFSASLVPQFEHLIRLDQPVELAAPEREHA